MTRPPHRSPSQQLRLLPMFRRTRGGSTPFLALLAALIALLTPAACSPADAFDAKNAQHWIDYEHEHSNYGTDREDVKQKLKDQVANATGNAHVTEQDELYYFFSLHDYDTDHHLDGHELRQAFADYTAAGGEVPLTIKEVNEMTDHVMKEDDLDGDGKISWEEYLASQSYHTT